jgi:CxxC motif-containing protein (DUF1111 family)
VIAPRAEHRDDPRVGIRDGVSRPFKTGESSPFLELRGQTIHPYTDLLLHDMGPELSDSFPHEFAATNRFPARSR